MLRCLGGNSPFLADMALREAAALCLFARSGPDAALRKARESLSALDPGTPRPHLAAQLRAAKRIVSLVTAAADIGGLWDLDRVTATLSDLAESALHLAVAHLLRAAHAAGDLRLPHPDQPERDCGFAVLGMGKLGARELNYSSDIDLVLLHDPDSGTYLGESSTSFYTRFAHNLVALMETRDADGYVFRVDLRLRPDPGATPACVSLPAAIAYYESLGQNWERAAMLKARPVAGDLALGAGFLQEIRPFVWRHHLDFAAVADIHAMKRRIDAVRQTGASARADPLARLLGRNVKLGHGGIREIEFLTQTLQLVWGGREPDLRVSRTLEALVLLARSGHLPARAASELATAYRFLRQVEHRLQMVADRQTHSLPERPDSFAAFALFLGYPDASSLAKVLLRHMASVQRHYLDVFEAVPSPPGPEEAIPLDFTGQDDPPEETTRALSEMGYANPARIVAVVRGWRAGRVRALRSQRARELILAMLPGLLAALARQPGPDPGGADAVFARFDTFLDHLPAGVQILSLFQRYPALLERVADVLGSAPPLADYLTRTPEALEGLLGSAGPHGILRTLRARLADAGDIEETLDIIRSTVRQEDFSTSIATLEGRLDADRAGEARTRLADAALTTLLPRVLADFASRFGRVRGGGLAVVVLGKAGSREMMAGSDLDLMFIYDHPADVAESSGGGGRRRLPASQWFIRAVHAFLAALTAPDAAGPMFDIDMRLRPSGNKGPVAISLAAFARYHAADRDHGGAWTWERMALTRARVVAGPAPLRRRVEAAIATAIAHAAPPGQVRADTAAMRARLLRDLPPAGPWDVKLRPGGQIEVEFIAQALQLIHAVDHPEVRHPAPRDAIAALHEAGLLPAESAARLIAADRLWRTIQGILRITRGHTVAGEPSGAAVAALLRAVASLEIVPGTVDLAALRTTMETCAQQVREAFVQLIGELPP